MDIAILLFDLLTTTGSERCRESAHALLKELLQPSTDPRVQGLSSLFEEGATKYMEQIRAESRAA